VKEDGGDGNAGYLYGWNELGWKDDWPYVKDAGGDDSAGKMHGGNKLSSTAAGFAAVTDPVPLL
jgi:arabinan endo-1,5-alpha-L-arabinosidase